MSVELAEKLAEFAERGNQQRIHLGTGEMLQGWVMEISDTALLISTGFAEKTGKDEWIEFTNIDLTRLEYWDNQADGWVVWQFADLK